MEKVRVQKWLSQQGVASRREAERWIAAGEVFVNGDPIRLGDRIDPQADYVTVNGKRISRQAPPLVYWLLHKPAGYLTSRQSQDEKPTIFDLDSLAHLSFLISPVGRLDFLTEGLLLLSNDGELVHRLCHPKYKVPRQYAALVNRRLSPEEELQLSRGISLKDGPVAGVDIRYLHGEKIKGGRGSWYYVTVAEGRNRIVRRLFEHFDARVVRLVRQGFGDLRLPLNLKPGQYIQLTSEQIRRLKNGAVTPAPQRKDRREARN